MKAKKETPLVYSCSGCSSAAQLANFLALQLNKDGTAEMSCIAGVGGDVPALVKKATEPDRKIVAIDGCPLVCVESCLKRHGVKPTLHIKLAEMGVKKIQNTDFDPADAERLYGEVKEKIHAL
ncbi:MAG: putative zinc-binding protein [Candidatus Paceibacterota bacterium]|jgi:uncharacterized metal-binding protein|nr:putative zinc-binding protein [Candidatus Paceibacterota bacterium]